MFVRLHYVCLPSLRRMSPIQAPTTICRPFADVMVMPFHRLHDRWPEDMPLQHHDHRLDKNDTLRERLGVGIVHHRRARGEGVQLEGKRRRGQFKRR